MKAELVYIPENGLAYVGKKYVRAVFAGNMPYRCRRCCFNHCKLEKCLIMACRDDEREDKKNVYFERYDKQDYNPQN